MNLTSQLEAKGGIRANRRRAEIAMYLSPKMKRANANTNTNSWHHGLS